MQKLGIISRNIVEKMNKKILKELDLNRWKNTDNVIFWFRNIPNNSECKFTQLDIKEF